MASALCTAAAARSNTTVEIRAERFFINRAPTYAGREWQGHRIEGLLMNSRMVQGIFDDENPETVHYWKYADTGKWDPARNTREFVAAMPDWRKHGLVSFDICLQGGNPKGYLGTQPWLNNAYRPDGTLKPAYMERLRTILDRADELGMAPMVCLFYFGQDQYFKDGAAIRRAVRETVKWIQERSYRNILLEIANECDNKKYEQDIIKPARVLELFDEARKAFRYEKEFPLAVSFCGRVIPTPAVAAASDYLLLHGNGVKDPKVIAQMVEQTRSLPAYRPMPVVFNEDDHYDFDQPENNYIAAVKSYASWGLLDIEGYQSPPVDWSASTERKRRFFDLTKRITGGA
jgi:hypothetical protein